VLQAKYRLFCEFWRFFGLDGSGNRLYSTALLLGNGVMVAPLTLDQLVGVRVPIPQRIFPPFQTEGFLCANLDVLSLKYAEKEKLAYVSSDNRNRTLGVGRS
jgi:hypothetical protein